MSILELLSSISYIVFWFAFLLAFCTKPETFTNLPGYIWWPMFFGLVTSGIADALLRF